MQPPEVHEVHRVLEAEREGLRRQLDELAAAPRDPMATVSFGKRVGEGTTQAVERLAQTSAFRSLSAKLQGVERALAKLQEGTYGICDRCGARIAEERLATIAWAVLCVRCASAR